MYSNVSVCPVVCLHLLGMYLNACNEIDNQNRLCKSDLALEKYWVTHRGYFRLETTVALGMVIKYGKLLYCNGVAEGNVYGKISTLDYNNRSVYDFFNNTFTDEFGSRDLNITPINFDDRPLLHKRSRYIPDLIPYYISVASESSFSTMITPSE